MDKSTPLWGSWQSVSEAGMQFVTRAPEERWRLISFWVGELQGSEVSVWDLAALNSWSLLKHVFSCSFKSSAEKIFSRSLSEQPALSGLLTPQLLCWNQFIKQFHRWAHTDFSPDLHLHVAVLPLSSQDLLLLHTWISFHAFAVSGSWADRSPLHDAAFQGRLLSLKTLIAQVKAHR